MMSSQELSLEILADFVNTYLPACIGAIAQVVFLLLPVDLKNWDSDLLNVMTYIAVQMLVAAIIFVGIPITFELYELHTFTSFYILLVVAVLGFIRAIRMIPLEMTHVDPIIVERRAALSFNELYDNQRVNQLAAVTLSAPGGISRYIEIKERIAKRKPDKVDEVGGGG